MTDITARLARFEIPYLFAYAGYKSAATRRAHQTGAIVFRVGAVFYGFDRDGALRMIAEGLRPVAL